MKKCNLKQFWREIFTDSQLGLIVFALEKFQEKNRFLTENIHFFF